MPNSTVRLTFGDGAPLYVSATRIGAFYKVELRQEWQLGATTKVILSPSDPATTFYVTETPEQIAAKLDDLND